MKGKKITSHIFVAPLTAALLVLLSSATLSQTSSQSKEAKPQNQLTNSTTAQQDQPVVKLGTELVSLTVTVTDPFGRFVTALTKENFEVYEDKVKQDIAFFSDADAPVSIGIIFDISGSMKGKISRAHEAMRRFVESSHDDDEYFLVGFNTSAKVLSDFTVDSSKLVNSLSLVEPKGNTALYDAAYLGVEKVRQGRHSKRALIIISDGQDNNSRYTYNELRKIVKEADVQIYAIGIVSLSGGSSLEFQGQAILEEVTRTTGGRAFFPNSEVELEEVITRIALELRHQYSLGYYPKDTSQNGRWHKLKVTVNPPRGLPRLIVRSKEGYYSTRK